MKLNNTLKFIFTTSLLLNVPQALFSQDIYVSKNYPKTDFRLPLDLPPSLAGSFGEIRGGHFHSGLDFRTNQREGYPVYAVADGYVSRLRVQIGGFGNAVYITHPNGYTSVYAHLQRFNDRITQIIRDYQYRKESFDVDFPLLPVEISVKKGEIIAWSGNTGSSGGPHLHFEIRDSETEETVNPQLFGINVPDRIKPVISALYMYRLNGNPFNESTLSQYFQVVGSNGNYRLNKSPVINFSKEVGFGISAIDQQFAGGNKNGVYSIELQLDSQTIFESVVERFSFENTRAVNSHIDYPAYLLHRRVVQKSFIEPGNPLGIYKTALNYGLIHLEDEKVHQLKYIVKDAGGNTSTLSFNIRNNPEAVLAAPEKTGLQRFAFNTENTFSAEGVRVTVPKGTLYNDINFNYSKSPRAAGFSSVHNIHTRLIPVHSNYDLWIKPDRPVPDYLKSKLLIADTRGISYGGSFDEKDGFVKASPRVFGNFYVSIDTIPPTIRPLNLYDEKSLDSQRKISFRISDNLSGINSFRGTIDGQWVLMEFDSKTATLWHTFDYRTGPGKHLFQLVVTDNTKNSRSYTATFYK